MRAYTGIFFAADLTRFLHGLRAPPQPCCPTALLRRPRNNLRVWDSASGRLLFGGGAAAPLGHSDGAWRARVEAWLPAVLSTPRVHDALARLLRAQRRGARGSADAAALYERGARLAGGAAGGVGDEASAAPSRVPSVVTAAAAAAAVTTTAPPARKPDAAAAAAAAAAQVPTHLRPQADRGRTLPRGSASIIGAARTITPPLDLSLSLSLSLLVLKMFDTKCA